ncbi:hypothetical protein [Streptomyces glaucescens]|uniref:PE-PGRS family protein n=1 Tax=Streptomyces glaucescens TaxID=1907 RepID=A0A089XFP9_STRGA|nr:hypothetical protein [Streptomyces glaucescens]AIR99964.1 hypothetical protein SGLAU_20055 [Streptomyces glaucescens]
MPTFHRQPEWQQPADRHTRLIDPVLTVRQLSRFDLSLKHVVRIDHALVFATPRGGYETFLPPRRPTRGEIMASRYTAVYEVDMGVHPFTDTLTLPSDNDAFEFTAEVDVTWQVLDPARFVAGGVRDVPALLLGELQQTARPVTRRFAIADSAAAEAELLKAVQLVGPLGAPAGLHVTWTLRLRRDQANIEHQQRLQSIDHSAEEQVRTARQGMRVDRELDHRHRQQDELQLGRAMEYGRQQQELLLQQQRWQQEQALLQGQHQLELQRVEAQKIEFYRWHLAQGGVQAWALHLAQHPEDSRLVMSSMREDQLRMIQAQMDLVKELLGGEGAEKFELEGPKQLALRTVSDILNQRLPGVPQNPPLLPPNAPAPPPHPGPETDADPGTSPGTSEDAAASDAPPAPTGPHATPPSPHATPQSPYATPPSPYATPPSPYAQQPAPGVPGGTPPAWQPPSPYTPPPMPYVPPPSAPYPPYSAGGPAPAPPGTPGGPPPSVPFPPQPGAEPPSAASPAWQPPAGYGTTPTAPPQPDPAAEHEDTRQDGSPRETPAP